MVADHAIALASGQKVEDYVIESVLGEGGFGITYLARQEALNKVFAVKEYLPRQIATRTANGAIRAISERDADQFAHGLDRFLDEARIMAQFSHPNIVQVQNFFEANGTAYLVMDYGEGQTLDEDLARRPLMDEAELRAILMPLLDGLGTMHAAGILHRDIKPGNVFIRHDKGPMWLDLGAARRCAGGRGHGWTTIVTPGFAPYEQSCSDLDQGPPTDIYALGATLYLAVTGTMPPDAPSRVKNDPMIPATVAAQGRFSRGFLAAIDAALAVDMADRPQDIRAWKDMLVPGTTPVGDPISNPVDVPEAVTRWPAATAQPGMAPRAPGNETLNLTGAPPRRKKTRRRLALAAALAAALAVGGVWGLGRHVVTTGTADSDRRAEAAADLSAEVVHGIGSAAAPKIREAETQARAEAERKSRAEVEHKSRAESERKSGAEAERKSGAEAERKSRAKAERKSRGDAKRAREDAYRRGAAAFAKGDAYGEALKRFREAAAAGHARAQNYLGVMYSKGMGTPPDHRAALKWYSKAADHGLAAAQHNLGVMYSQGIGVTRDPAQAVRWYRKAAARGHSRSRLNLGVMYSKGLGVPQDYVRAHMWFNLAAAAGVLTADWNAKVLESRMTEQETQLARKLAERWRQRR